MESLISIQEITISPIRIALDLILVFIILSFLSSKKRMIPIGMIYDSYIITHYENNVLKRKIITSKIVPNLWDNISEK